MTDLGCSFFLNKFNEVKLNETLRLHLWCAFCYWKEFKHLETTQTSIENEISKIEPAYL